MSMRILHAERGREAVLYGVRPAAGLVNRAVKVALVQIHNAHTNDNKYLAISYSRMRPVIIQPHARRSVSDLGACRIKRVRF